jgi:hypothetical protein
VLNRMTGLGMPVSTRIRGHASREGGNTTACLLAHQRGCCTLPGLSFVSLRWAQDSYKDSVPLGLTGSGNQIW